MSEFSSSRASVSLPTTMWRIPTICRTSTRTFALCSFDSTKYDETRLRRLFALPT